MLITVCDSSLASPRTVASPLKVTHCGVMGNSNTVICWSAGGLKVIGRFTERHGDKIIPAQIFHLFANTYLCWIYSSSALHTWQAGEDTLVILFSKLLYPSSNCLCSSWLHRLAPLLVFRSFMKLFTLFPCICYSTLPFYQHQFHFHTDSTAPLHSMVLVRLEMFAYIFCSSLQTVARCSAIWFIPYFSLPLFQFTIVLWTGTSIGHFKLVICTKFSLYFLFPTAAAIHSA